jgi:hypothetical protein
MQTYMRCRARDPKGAVLWRLDQESRPQFTEYR